MSTNLLRHWLNLGPNYARRLACRTRRARPVLEELEDRLVLAAPMAVPGGPYTVSQGSSVTLNGSASFDPDVGDQIVSYSWDLNNDGQFDDATGAMPTIAWSVLALLPPGIANPIHLRVTDTIGLTGTASTTLMTVMAVKLYTLDADFDQGVYLNLNHTAPNSDQLQLNKTPTPFPFINVAESGRGTMARIDTATGAVLGEYWTAPQNRPKNPSRTTVDQVGNVWVTNRDENTGNSGSIVKIGLVIGGTRGDKLPDGSFQPNAAGQYLQGPFTYSTVTDRDGDGLIRTSGGLTQVLAWPNTSGVDTDGGVDTAQDEAILIYQRLPGAPNARHVSVDQNNDVWVGGYPYYPTTFHKLDDQTGTILASFSAAAIGAGGYGGLMDNNGVIWSASLDQWYLLRYDTNTNTGTRIVVPASYGLGIDTNGYIWNSTWVYNGVYKISPAGAVVGTFGSGGSGSRGVAVTPADNNVWIANSYSNTVTRLNNSGTLLKTIPVGAHPTGVAVDAEGKVWVTNYNSHNVMRINPTGGADGKGAVDLTVNLGAGAYPYNYSDMTGIVSIGATSPQGSWTATRDGLSAGTKWGAIAWNTEAQGSVPPGTQLIVEARAGDNPAGLGSYTTPVNGVDTPLVGRYIEVRVTFKASAGGLSPVLSDLSITTEEVAPPKVIGISHYAADPGEDAATHQRSVIRHLRVLFDKAVTIDPLGGAFELLKTGGPAGGGTGPVGVSVNTFGPATEFILSFSGSLTQFDSLTDGSYQLTIVASKVVDAAGFSLDGDEDDFAGGNKMDSFFRFFGDTDGDGDVDNTDLFRLSKVNAGVSAYGAYLAALDFNFSGGLDAADKSAFAARYGKKKTW